MGAIAGAWNLDGRPAEPEFVPRALEAMAERSPDGSHHWLSGAVALGAGINRITPESATEEQPLIGSSVILFDGRLDNRVELANELGSVTPEAPDPAFVAAAYDRWHEDFPAHLSGDFALAVFDLARQVLLLARDAMGARPLHYAHVQGVIIFASTIRAVCAHPLVEAKPRRDTLARLMLDNATWHDEADADQMGTFIDGVYSVKPGSVVVASPARIATRQAWDFDREASSGAATFEDNVEALRMNLDHAVRRRLRSLHPIGVLGGDGMCSQAVLDAARTSTDPARLVPAKRARFTHLLDDARALIASSEQPAIVAPPAHVARTMITGMFGTGLTYNLDYLSDMVDHFRWTETRRHLQANPGHTGRFFSNTGLNHTPGFLHPALTHLNRAARAEWFPESFINQARGTRTHLPRRAFASASGRHVYSLARSARASRIVDAMNKSSAAMEVAHPFMDRDLVAFLMSVPGEQMMRDGQPNALLRAALGPSAMKAPPPHRPSTPTAADLLANWEDIHWLLTGHAAAVEAGFVDRAALTEELPHARISLQQGDETTATALTRLLGLELWLEEIAGW